MKTLDAHLAPLSEALGTMMECNEVKMRHRQGVPPAGLVVVGPLDAVPCSPVALCELPCSVALSAGKVLVSKGCAFQSRETQETSRQGAERPGSPPRCEWLFGVRMPQQESIDHFRKGNASDVFSSTTPTTTSQRAPKYGFCLFLCVFVKRRTSAIRSFWTSLATPCRWSTRTTSGWPSPGRNG